MDAGSRDKGRGGDAGVDAPRVGREAGCTHEETLGNAAFRFSEHAIRSARSLEFADMRWGASGAGKVIALVMIDGQNLAKLLIEAGLARPYEGGRRFDWRGRGAAQ